MLGCCLGCASAPQGAVAPVRVPAGPKAPALVHVALDGQHGLVLLDVERGAERIGERDAFVRALTPLDRRLRVGTSAEVDEATFLAHARAQVRAFEPAQIEKLRMVAAKAGQGLTELGFAHWLPAEIELVQTTGAEEGLPPLFDLSYTRGFVIYVNTRALSVLSAQLLLHELFHVLANAHPELSTALYASIGFEKVNIVDYAPEVEAVRMSTDQAPFVAYGIRAWLAGVPVLAVPLTVASEVDPDAEMIDAVTTRWAIVGADGRVGELVPFEALSGVNEQIGKNTPGIESPDEILAESFAFLVQGARVRSPEPLERLRQALSRP